MDPQVFSLLCMRGSLTFLRNLLNFNEPTRCSVNASALLNGAAVTRSFSKKGEGCILAPYITDSTPIILYAAWFSQAAC